MAEPSVLLDGIQFGESVRWHDGRVWFSDWGAGEVVVIDVVDGVGQREVVHRSEVFPFSLDWLTDGSLLIVSDHLRREDPDGRMVIYADLSHLAAVGWNEIAADRRGNVFVNQIGFDLLGGAEPRSGTIAVATPGGAVREVANDVWFPNGMAVTADDSTLIVAESYRNRLTAYDIGEDGDLGNRRVWAELGTGVPDGICIDIEGAVWYADVPNQKCVRVREGGEVLQTVTVDRGCFSCALGGEDGRTLFMVATVWGGPEAMAKDGPTSQLLAVEVDCPAAQRRG